MSTGNGAVSLEGSIDCDGHILEPARFMGAIS